MSSLDIHPQVTEPKLGFREELRVQRWDDHRFYHQSRINQTLHFFSAICFLIAYITLFYSPSAAAIIGWLLAMVSRQAGHFFFEPRGYDQVNDASHELKEQIKVGYNLSRKRVLHAVWFGIPVLLLLTPDLFGMTEGYESWRGYVNSVGLFWIALGVSALLFRMLQLFVQQNVQTGLVWVTKILTDPFHDIKMYRKAPVYLLRGELLDPMDHVREQEAVSLR